MRVCPRKVTQSPPGYITPVGQKQCAAQLRKIHTSWHICFCIYFSFNILDRRKHTWHTKSTA
jgi:hypothetical protein